MTESNKILGTAEAWESGALGMNPETAVRMSEEDARMLDAALGLEEITFRLSTDTLAALQANAEKQGVGLKPFIRMVLNEFVNNAPD